MPSTPGTSKPFSRSLVFQIALAFLVSGLVTLGLFMAGTHLAFQLSGAPDRPDEPMRSPFTAVDEWLKADPDWTKPDHIERFVRENPPFQIRVVKNGAVLFDNFGDEDPHHHGIQICKGDEEVFCAMKRPPFGIFKLPMLFPLVFVLVVTFVFLFLYIRRVLRPLGLMIRVTRAMSQGNLDSRLPEADTREFDLLFRSFNDMAEKLEASFTNHRMMLGNISHDLKHHLNRMKLTVELDVPDEAARRSLNEDIGSILHYVERAREALRAVGGRSLFQMAETDLSGMVAGLSAEAKIPAEVAPGIATRADATFLPQLVRNLLDNAGRHGRDPRVRLLREGPGFVLEVENGLAQPIDPKELPLLFQPFYRGDASRTRVQGSGLGLFIARSVAEGHGFDLRLELPEAGRFKATVTGPAL